MNKLKEYEEYQGYYDGFYLQKVKYGKNLISDMEWKMVSDLTQDIRLVQRNLASKEFVNKLNMKILERCDSQDAIKYLEEIAAKGW
ncbi:hypothetical protein [Taibaiella chishuiensis]|uniref:hypothetical protein n=1 Tax=Taibaiella chishuiensis TaxID=1434707 RepID=UPI0011B25931|nr:hypothetical protein [Taibaiella chishuiensis]